MQMTKLDSHIREVNPATDDQGCPNCCICPNASSRSLPFSPRSFGPMKALWLLLSFWMSRQKWSGRMMACSNDSNNNVCPSNSTGKVPAGEYYSEYHGHTVNHLETIRAALENNPHCEEIVYLMGDSTLDNKHWIFLDDKDHDSKEESLRKNKTIAAKAINGYEDVLDPPLMVKDVCYWMNQIALDQNRRVCTILGAVEESTVASRKNGTSLLEQDEFIARNLRSTDTLVVSLGGNDLALEPTQETAMALHSLVNSSPSDIFDGTAQGYSHIMDIFHSQVERILSAMIHPDRPPKAIIVCALYFLDESPENFGSSWADPVLEALGYREDPSKIQRVLKAIHRHMEDKGFHLAKETNTTIKIFPMFKVLDGKNTEDYLERVEPSIHGGRKIARGLMDLIL